MDETPTRLRDSLGARQHADDKHGRIRRPDPALRSAVITNAYPPRFLITQHEQNMVLVAPWRVRAEEEVVDLPSRDAEAWARFDVFFEEEGDRLFKALYFVTGNRHDAEELTQDAFLKLWERWDQVDRIDDPTAYLFRVALNAFRRRRRRAATAVRKLTPVTELPDAFEEAEMRADVRQLLLGLTQRQRAALLLVDLLGYPSEEAARILRVRPSTVRSLATQGRRALRAEGARDA
jgi:RNA polymerase sigma factor (sigma-70 family)